MDGLHGLHQGGSSFLAPGMMLAFTLTCLKHGIDTAYMSSMVFDHVTVHGFLTSATRSYRLMHEKSIVLTRITSSLLQLLADERQATPQLPALWSSSTSPAAQSRSCGASILRSTTESASVVPSKMPSVSANVQMGDGVVQDLVQRHGPRMSLAIISCLRALVAAHTQVNSKPNHSQKEAVKNNKCFTDAASLTWMADIYLLHTALLRILPLEARALERLSRPSREVAPDTYETDSGANTTVSKTPASPAVLFMESLQPALLAHFSALQNYFSSMGQAAQPHAYPEWFTANQIRSELADLYDGRLFEHLVLIFSAQDALMREGLHTAKNLFDLAVPPDVFNRHDAAKQELLRLLKIYGSTFCTDADRAPGWSTLDSATTPTPVADAILQCYGRDTIMALVQASCKVPMPQHAAQYQNIAIHRTSLNIRPSAGQIHQRFASEVLGRCGFALPGPEATPLAMLPKQVQNHLPTGMEPLFGCSAPYEEKYHWHVRLEMEPAFFTEVGGIA